MGLSYVLAVVLLSIYGTEVCPYIDGLGLGSVFVTFAGVFSLCFVLRCILFGNLHVRGVSFLIELGLWVLAGTFISHFNAVFHTFPIDSGVRSLWGVSHWVCHHH